MPRKLYRSHGSRMKKPIDLASNFQSSPCSVCCCLQLLMLVKNLSLFYSSCGVLRDCSISVWCACTTGLVQIKTNSRGLGDYKKKEAMKNYWRKEHKKLIQAIFIDQPVYLQLLLRDELLNDTCFHPGHRFKKCMQVQLSSPKRQTFGQFSNLNVVYELIFASLSSAQLSFQHTKCHNQPDGSHWGYVLHLESCSTHPGEMLSDISTWSGKKKSSHRNMYPSFL